MSYGGIESAKPSFSPKTRPTNRETTLETLRYIGLWKRVGYKIPFAGLDDGGS